MQIKELIAYAIGTWFGCGLAPGGPGTVGTLGGLVVALWLHLAYGWGQAQFAGMSAVLLLPGVWGAGEVARMLGSKDPGRVVVDEVLGLWITMTGAPALHWKWWALGFIVFRILDIWKPFPVRQLERLPGGWGIVADDVGAGLYGALVLFLAGCLTR
jgi:phosphatidylglycerophosphatase A